MFAVRTLVLITERIALLSIEEGQKNGDGALLKGRIFVPNAYPGG